jgi:nitroreductase
MSAPRFGEPLPIVPSPETLAFLARRRSASALTLVAPAPTDEEISALLTIAARVPDHGKLAPWRFVVLRDELVAKLGKLRTPPLCIAVVSRYVEGEIPEWEQRLSAGAVCMLLVVAAQAMGYGANWITDWYAYDKHARKALGLHKHETIAGFVYIGTPSEPPLERARPEVGEITTWFEG